MNGQKIKTSRFEKVVALLLILIGLIQGIGQIYYLKSLTSYIPNKEVPLYLMALYWTGVCKSFLMKVIYIVAGIMLFRNRKTGWILAVITLSFASVNILVVLFGNGYYWRAPIIVWNLLPLFLFVAVVLPYIRKKHQVKLHWLIFYITIGIALHIDRVLIIIAENSYSLQGYFLR
ncbi:MAG: hypothetical protein MUD08_16740 [Cytophagales bacterium]|jgi:hypothetical protein|nr:hypothetical protein [Cytophagales bacterium]